MRVLFGEGVVKEVSSVEVKPMDLWRCCKKLIIDKRRGPMLTTA